MSPYASSQPCPDQLFSWPFQFMVSSWTKLVFWVWNFGSHGSFFRSLRHHLIWQQVTLNQAVLLYKYTQSFFDIADLASLIERPMALHFICQSSRISHLWLHFTIDLAPAPNEPLQGAGRSLLIHHVPNTKKIWISAWIVSRGRSRHLQICPGCNCTEFCQNDVW